MASETEARRLAGYLLGSRTTPVIVITTAAGQAQPYLDVHEIAGAVSGLAELHVLPTGPVSWAFSEAMPPGTQVYGGASRVYPVDGAWRTDLSESPLRFAFGPDDGPVTEAIIGDAMRMALAAGLLRQTARSVCPAAGRVSMIIGGRGLVRVDDGGVATLWPELVLDGVEPERLFVEGMLVKGQLDLESRRLDVSAMRVDAPTALAEYSMGGTVLGRVLKVERGHVALQLLPCTKVTVQAFDAAGDPSADLRALFTVGEVVPSKVITIGHFTGSGWRLNLVDASECSVLPSPAILEGGPSWLVVPDGEPDEPDGECVVLSGSAGRMLGDVVARQEETPPASVSPRVAELPLARNGATPLALARGGGPRPAPPGGARLAQQIEPDDHAVHTTRVGYGQAALRADVRPAGTDIKDMEAERDGLLKEVASLQQRLSMKDRTIERLRKQHREAAQ